MGNSTYSSIIDPSLYCRIMDDHFCLAEADAAAIRFVKSFRDNPHWNGYIMEGGSGPGRFTNKLHEAVSDVTVIAVDHDVMYQGYARNHCKHRNRVQYIFEDCTKPQSWFSVPLIVLQGVFHHFPTQDGTRARAFQTFRSFLPSGGRLIVSDEFLAPYEDEEQRMCNAIQWYSHVVALAQPALAVEEAKTLLDDLPKLAGPKTCHQINLIIQTSVNIKELVTDGQLLAARDASLQLYSALLRMRPARAPLDWTMSLSRGDEKCDVRRFLELATPYFKVVSSESFGPMETCGGFVVFEFEAI